MMMATRYLGALLLFSLLAACDPGPCPEGSSVLWVDVEPLFTEYCTSCHSSELVGDDRLDIPVAYDYDTAEESRSHPNWTWAEIKLGFMPPTVEMSEQEQQLIREWLACGGPE